MKSTCMLLQNTHYIRRHSPFLGATHITISRKVSLKIIIYEWKYYNRTGAQCNKANTHSIGKYIAIFKLCCDKLLSNERENWARERGRCKKMPTFFSIRNDSHKLFICVELWKHSEKSIYFPVQSFCSVILFRRYIGICVYMWLGIKLPHTRTHTHIYRLAKYQ